MANHSMATKSKSNSHTAEMTEEEASKTEVADDLVGIGEIGEIGERGERGNERFNQDPVGSAADCRPPPPPAC